MTSIGRVGLIGDPVEHSLSPAFQQAAFDALGLRARYELWRTTAAQLPDRLAELRTGAALGANVTAPHKEAVFAAMDEVSDLARRVGAVNTIIQRAGRLLGDNTDAHGFLAPLRARQFNFAACDAVVLGAGGAARGVVVALLEAGARRVTIVNRSRSRADAMVAAIGDARLSTARAANATDVAEAAQLLVNATALGWEGVQLPCDARTFSVLAAGALAYDLTYRETAFLRAAAEAGVEPLDGLAMLVHQGARSFELWTGRDAPVDLMWASALQARARRYDSEPHGGLAPISGKS
jgi:shikimate dehydrogenase